MSTTTTLQTNDRDPNRKARAEALLTEELARITGASVAVSINRNGVIIATTGGMSAALTIQNEMSAAKSLRHISTTEVPFNGATGDPAHWNILFAWK